MFDVFHKQKEIFGYSGLSRSSTKETKEVISIKSMVIDPSFPIAAVNNVPMTAGISNINEKDANFCKIPGILFLLNIVATPEIPVVMAYKINRI